MQVKYKILLKDLIVFAMGSFLSKIILFFLVPFYTNCLSPDEFGSADLNVSIATLLASVLSLMICRSVIRFAMDKNERKEDVLFAAILMQLFVFIASIIVYFILGLFVIEFEYKVYFCAQIVVTSVSDTSMMYLKAIGKNKLYALIGVLQTITLAISNLIFLRTLELGASGYLLANVLAYAVTAFVPFVAGGLLRDLSKSRLSLSLLYRMIKYSLPVVVATIFSWVIRYADRFVIERILGGKSLGLYSVATKIPAFLNFFVGIFNQAWLLSAIREADDDDSIAFYSRVFSLFSFFMIGLGIALVSIIKPFMNYYVTDEFNESRSITVILLAGGVFYAIGVYFGGLFNAIRKTKNEMWSMVICACADLILCIVLVPAFGITGAAFSSLISYMVFANMRILDIKKLIDIKIDFLNYIVNTLLLIIVSLCVFYDYYPVAVSALSIAFYVVFNYKTIKFIILKLLKRQIQ